MVERHEPVWESEHKFGLGPRAAVALLTAQRRLLRKPTTDFDLMIVGYPGHFDLGRARRAAGAKPVVFNPMLSLYDSIVHDRGRWSDGSPQARVLRAVDRRSMRAADLVIADTDVHADYFAKLAGIPRDRIEVCFLGAEEPLFSPGWKPREAFGLPVLRQVDPPPWARHDPRRGSARAGDSVPDRGSRSARGLCSSTTCRPTSTGFVGWRTRKSRTRSGQRGVRSGSSEPPTRRQG